jgi:hypothetical protein
MTASILEFPYSRICKPEKHEAKILKLPERKPVNLMLWPIMFWLDLMIN